jgi:hypothetical protein
MEKRDYFVAWAEDLLRAAGIVPIKDLPSGRPDLVAEHAQMAASSQIFLMSRAAKAWELEEFDSYLTSTDASGLEGFDQIYLTLLRMRADRDSGTDDSLSEAWQRSSRNFASNIDGAIAKDMAENWPEYVHGVRGAFANGEFAGRARRLGDA